MTTEILDILGMFAYMLIPFAFILFVVLMAAAIGKLAAHIFNEDKGKEDKQ